MEHGEYREGLLLTYALATGLARAVDVPAMLAAIEYSEAVAPIIDPTLYRDNAGCMGEDKAVLQAALPLWRLGKKVLERSVEEGL